MRVLIYRIGFLDANSGEEVSRTEYAELFAEIGTTFGEGDGSTTFNLPRKAGRVTIGVGEEMDLNGDVLNLKLGQTIGEYKHAINKAELAVHNHTGAIAKEVGDGGGAVYYFTPTGATDGPESVFSQSLTIGNEGEGQPHNNIQPGIGGRYIIKAKKTVNGEVDTGWQPLTLTENAVAATNPYGGSIVPQYRIVGKHVFLRGSLKVTWNGSGSMEVATLPTRLWSRTEMYTSLRF